MVVAAFACALLAWRGPALAPRGTRTPPATLAIPPDVKLKLAQGGLAIPGMEDAAREATAERLAASAPAAERLCTAAAPCAFDAGAFLSSAATVPLAVVALALIGGLAGATADDDEFLEALEARAERSRRRRELQLRNFAKAVKPLQDSPLGWRLVDAQGMPTPDAYVFLAIAVAAQAWLASWLWQAAR